jgi:hypothetical protein
VSVTSPAIPRQLIRVGDRELSLPEGVSVADWGLERTARQNPRLRAFLGCIRQLDGVIESNYAILHCSPARLQDIWDRVRRVSELLRTRVGPLLDPTSCIPRLDQARRAAQVSLTILRQQVLEPLESFPEEIPETRQMELRKLLCISVGQLHAFLHEAFGELVANDPRSTHESDYFLSRRFPRDVEEAEWLLVTVRRLLAYLRGNMAAWWSPLPLVAQRLRDDRRLLGDRPWGEVQGDLTRVRSELVPRIQEVLALPGIRFDEMEVLDRYATELPILCRRLMEIAEIGAEIRLGLGEREGTAGGEDDFAASGRFVEAVLSRRLADGLVTLHDLLEDLTAFLPVWLEGIEKRRALWFRQSGEGEG